MKERRRERNRRGGEKGGFGVNWWQGLVAVVVCVVWFILELWRFVENTNKTKQNKTKQNNAPQTKTNRENLCLTTTLPSLATKM